MDDITVAEHDGGEGSNRTPIGSVLASEPRGKYITANSELGSPSGVCSRFCSVLISPCRVRAAKRKAYDFTISPVAESRP